MADDASSDVQDLLQQLSELACNKKLKPRDLHEVKVLKEILDGDKYAVIRRRLTELYVASTRSWKEATAWAATPPGDAAWNSTAKYGCLSEPQYTAKSSNRGKEEVEDSPRLR